MGSNSINLTDGEKQRPERADGLGGPLLNLSQAGIDLVDDRQLKSLARSPNFPLQWPPFQNSERPRAFLFDSHHKISVSVFLLPTTLGTPYPTLPHHPPH